MGCHTWLSTQVDLRMGDRKTSSLSSLSGQISCSDSRSDLECTGVQIYDVQVKIATAALTIVLVDNRGVSLDMFVAFLFNELSVALVGGICIMVT